MLTGDLACERTVNDIGGIPICQEGIGILVTTQRKPVLP